MTRRTPSLIVIFITMLLDTLGIGLIIPVAPRLVAMVQGMELHGSESQTSVAVGALMATYAAMQFIFAPILGSLSDRFGRRPVILIALFGSGLDYLVAALAPNLAVLFVTRAINGISGANISACTAYIADITPPEKRSAAFGMVGAAFGLGFAFGPLAGGLLGNIDIRLPYVIAGVLTLVNWCFALFVVPESLPRDRRRPFSWAKANPLGALKWLTHHPVVTAIAASLFLFNVAQFGLHSTWVLSMEQRFGWGTLAVGISLGIVGVAAMVVQGGLVRKLIPALGERVCLAGGIMVGVLAFAGYGLATHGWMIYVMVAIASIGGVAGPAAQGVMSKAVPPTEQGLLQGALAGLASIAGVIGPLVGTAVFRTFTTPPLSTRFSIGGSAPFYSGAILMLLSLAPIAMIWGRLPRTVKQAPEEGNAGSSAAGETA